MAWNCPECGRPFAKRRAHVCAPGMTVDAYFEGRPPELRKIYDAVAKHVKKLGPLHLEAVSVGILFKTSRTFAELRPRRVGFALSLVVPRDIVDERITRRIAMTNGRMCLYVWLQKPADVDARVRGWLTESYATSSS